MSRPERSVGEAPERAAIQRLDTAVDQVLDQVRDLRARVRAVEGRNSELEALMARFETGSDSPGDFVQRMRALEAENGDLRGRIERGREAVERLLARIRFLEERR